MKSYFFPALMFLYCVCSNAQTDTHFAWGRASVCVVLKESQKGIIDHAPLIAALDLVGESHKPKTIAVYSRWWYSIEKGEQSVSFDSLLSDRSMMYRLISGQLGIDKPKFSDFEISIYASDASPDAVAVPALKAGCALTLEAEYSDSDLPCIDPYKHVCSFQCEPSGCFAL